MFAERNSRVWQTIPLFLTIVLLCPIANSKVIYVDDDAPGTKNGSSWENAYISLHNGLKNASTGDEIRVAQGIYYPSEPTWPPEPRSAAFTLKDGVIVRGGYAGYGEPDSNAHDYQIYNTILSGDLDCNDHDVNDPCDLYDDPTHADNSYRVLVGHEISETTVLDGFTITGGNSEKIMRGYLSGAGIDIYKGNPTISNCTFTWNCARCGGAMSNFDAAPVVIGCSFMYNWAEQGGAVYNTSSNPTFIGCTLVDNAASLHGGGIWNHESNVAAIDCTLDSNKANVGGGGGISIDSSCRLQLNRCIFTGNFAQMGGGGIHGVGDGITHLTDCTFSGNVAVTGGGIGTGYGHGHLLLSQCIFERNSAEGGGAIHYNIDRVELNDCTFINNSAGGSGGGVAGFNVTSNLEMIDCIFIGNSAGSSGGGIITNASTQTWTRCAFVQNSAGNGGGVRSDGSTLQMTSCILEHNYSREAGGGMYCANKDSLIEFCIFNGNSAGSQGGGLANYGGNQELRSCKFNANRVYATDLGYRTAWGGGVFSLRISTTILDCLFTGNRVDKAYDGSHGGGLYVAQGRTIMTNCTFASNVATHGSALASFTNPKAEPTYLEITNTIFWDNADTVWQSANSTTNITYSDVRGNWPGEGIIDEDPCFINLGYWDPNGTPDDPNDDVWVNGDYHLTPYSPCINQGDPNYIGEPNDIDLDGNTRVIGGRIDMGAYEYPFVYNKPNEGSTPGSWWKYSENPVFTEAESGQWDSCLNGCVTVLKDCEESVIKYKMWYVGGEIQFFEGAGIGYAASTDGINWVRNEENPVLEPGEWWNVNGFSGICVIKDGPIYKLWYEGIDNEGVSRIGYATSSDGILWNINNSNPVFSPGHDDALDNDNVGNPCVVKEGSTYRMWYWGDNNLTGIDQIGLAVSNDGINWQRTRNRPVIAPDPSIWWQDGEGVGTPQVLKVNTGYVMVYHAADQIGTIRIGLAMSSDGLEWTKELNPILDLGAENSWESIGIGPGSLIQDTLHLKLYYIGIDASEIIKVGLAVSYDDIVFDIGGNN